MNWHNTGGKIENSLKHIKLDTKKILYYILLSGGVIALSILAPKLPYELLKYYLKKKKFDHSKFNRDLKRLNERGEIKIGQNKLTITKKGKSRVLEYQLGEMQIKKPIKWDRKWRLVVFDIPDFHRKASNTLRRKLRDLGFEQYQKSIFIHPYPCQDELDFIKEIFEVGPYVKLIIAEQIDGDERFKRKFDLV